jgi:WHEP-TRS domain
VSAIALKGDEIRQLKANKAGKDAITPVVAELLQLKKEFEILTGNPFDPPKEGAAVTPPPPPAAVPKAKGVKKEDSQSNVNAAKGVESTVITPRDVDYSAW